jgi:Sulfotransferase family
VTVKVVAITGAGRSGSTIFDNLLGEVDSFCSVGELRFLWQRSLVDKRLCGCGKTVYDCEFWPRVFAEAFGGFDAVDGADVASLMGLVRTRYTPGAVLAPARGWYARRLAPLVPYLDSLYPAIAAVAGARVIVDSSKVPAHTFLLSLVPSIDLHVVHLARDPRAVAHSQSRPKAQLDTAQARDMTRTPAIETAAYWDMWNAATRAIFKRSPRYTMLTYEALMAEPERTIRAVLDRIGEADAALPFTSERTVTLHPNHTVSGNPSRFSTGAVTLRRDDAWRRDMPAFDRRLVTVVAAPFMRPYGYPLRVEKDAS